MASTFSDMMAPSPSDQNNNNRVCGCFSITEATRFLNHPTMLPLSCSCFYQFPSSELNSLEKNMEAGNKEQAGSIQKAADSCLQQEGSQEPVAKQHSGGASVSRERVDSVLPVCK